MGPDEREAERLNEVIEAADRDAAAVPELAPLLNVVDRLLRSARPEPGVPRPSFVLGLEEQLRTDLRLETGRVQPPTRWLHRLGIVSVTVTGFLVLGLVVPHVGPAHPLRSLQVPLRSLRLALTFTPRGRTDVLLDDGWRRIQEVRMLAASGRLDEATLRGLLPELEAVYGEALRVSAGTAREEQRVRTEAAAAAAVLGEVAATAPPAVAAVATTGQAALEARIGRVGPIAGVVLPPATPSPTGAPAAARATASATAPPRAATALPTATLPPPTVTPRPTVVPTVTSLPAPPAATATPRTPPRREPRTPTPTAPVATPSPVPASPTADAWPTPTRATPEPTPGPGPVVSVLPPTAGP